MTKEEKAGGGNERITALLNRIMEYELAGVVRYTHYSLMVFGYNRIPIISWLSGQADELLAHAHKAGEMITHLGGHPSLGIGPCWKPTNTISAISCASRWSMKRRRCSFTATCSRK